MKFKESVKIKGRPRKKNVKQVTFNKTALDKTKNRKPKVVKKSSKKAKVDFIDDEDLEEDLLDESSYDEESPNASVTSDTDHDEEREVREASESDS